MSWIIRSAVHKASLTRIRTYADSVVQHAGQAVVGGAKLFHGRINMQGSGHVQSLQLAVKRLEELAVSSRGEERVLMLRGWLDSLKEVENFKKSLVDAENRNEETDESTHPTLALYQDMDHEGEPLTFLDVFLRSEALEGLTLSMILEAPRDEEGALALEIFGHCLMGGKEVHSAILGSIQDLAKVISSYDDEVLMKRDELLQSAQSSISGLKISANQARIDVEVTNLKTELMKEIKIPLVEGYDKSSRELEAARTQAMKEALAQVRLYSKLKALLLRKKDVHHGDSPEVHAQKMDKLKILLHSLANTSSKAENKIEDHRRRREEAVSFRTVKVNEVSQVEQDLVAEIEKLQQRKDDLEAQLSEVNNSLAAANGRLQISKEERLHFDKASTEILHHFQSKEQELVKSVALCKIESDIASAWISFTESTWRLQCNFTKQKEEFIDGELGKYTEHFVDLSLQLLPAYKNELMIPVKTFEEHAQKLQDMSIEHHHHHHSLSLDTESIASAKRKKKLEDEYLDLEEKLVSAFSVIESIKQLLAQCEPFYRKDIRKVQELIDDLQKFKDEFESIDRPDLIGDTPTTIRWRKIAKKLAFPKKHEIAESKPNPDQQQEKGDSNDHKSKQNSKRVPVIDEHEMLDSEYLPHQHHKEEDSIDKIGLYSKYNQVHVIDGQELLGSDEEMTALEKEFVIAVNNDAAHELNDWEL